MLAYDLPPIQVFERDGFLFSIDNRRLLAYNSAGIERIPVQKVSLDDPIVAARVRDRFDPINSQGIYAVVVNKAERNEALDLLYEHNMIRGIHRGY